MSLFELEKTEGRYKLRSDLENRILIAPLGCGGPESGEELEPVHVRDRREVELLLHCLGDLAELELDEHLREDHPDVWNWLQGRDVRELLAEARLGSKEVHELVPILEKIPIPECIRRAGASGHGGFGRIDCAYVHKVHPENVLIAPLVSRGKVLYFQGFPNSKEFSIDHPSDHVEGIIIFETLRQAAIASLHCAGLPLEGRIIMLDALLKYKQFVGAHVPFFIRTIGVTKPSGGNCGVVFELIQEDHSCVSGMFKAFSFKNHDAYKRFAQARA